MGLGLITKRNPNSQCVRASSQERIFEPVMSSPTSVDYAEVTASNREARSGLPGEYGPYPFNPHTAFQGLSPRLEHAIEEEVGSAGEFMLRVAKKKKAV
jgi:hypothetical protein